jgi:glucosamine-6-phosphate deaminase
MEKIIFDTPELLGKEAAAREAFYMNQAVREKESARLLLSTGQSQFEFFQHMIKEDVDWSKVEVFHLDEYIGIAENHPAGFVNNIEERFLRFVPVKKAYLVDGSGNVEENIKYLTEEIRKAPIDVAMIGIGENSHIAFNDPPADFDTKESFIIVTLDEKCRSQQVGEGWFENLGQVPEKAVTITVHQIMQSKHILSCVPHKVKAPAVKQSIEEDVTNKVPATILKTHPSWVLLLDKNSASLL